MQIKACIVIASLPVIMYCYVMANDVYCCQAMCVIAQWNIFMADLIFGSYVLMQRINYLLAYCVLLNLILHYGPETSIQHSKLSCLNQTAITSGHYHIKE